MADERSKTDEQRFADLIKTVYEEGINGKKTSPTATVEEIKARIKIIYK